MQIKCYTTQYHVVIFLTLSCVPYKRKIKTDWLNAKPFDLNNYLDLELTDLFLKTITAIKNKWDMQSETLWLHVILLSYWHGYENKNSDCSLPFSTDIFQNNNNFLQLSECSNQHYHSDHKNVPTLSASTYCGKTSLEACLRLIMKQLSDYLSHLSTLVKM